jgi:hypothetical protein
VTSVTNRTTRDELKAIDLFPNPAFLLVFPVVNSRCGEFAACKSRSRRHIHREVAL